MKTTYRWAMLFLLAGGALRAATPAVGELELIPPTSFVIDVPLGGPDPTPSTLTIHNKGTGNLDWTAAVTYTSPASPPSNWLEAPTGTRLHTNESIGVPVKVTVGTLPAGIYNAKITVTGGGTSLDATVQMRVNAVPVLSATPTLFGFATPAGVNPPSQTLTVQNAGGGTLDWTFSSNQPWVTLNAAPNPGPLDLGPAGSQTVQVVVTTGALAPGAHQAKITLSAPGTTNVEVTVNLTVNANPAIGLNPTSLAFEAPVTGPSPAPKQFTIKNEGGGTLTWDWDEAVSPTWLALNPPNGVLSSGSSQVVTVTVTLPTGPSALAEGSHPATISITALAPVTNSPQTLGVLLTINSTPKIGLSQQNLSFVRAFDLGPSPPAAISITNTGSGTLSWSVSGGAAWVKSSPSLGSLTALSSEPLLLSVDPSGLSPGVYTTTLDIVDPAASNSPRTISVEMTVTPSSLPTTAPAGQCGLLGLEMLALMVLLRSLKSRGGSSCTSR